METTAANKSFFFDAVLPKVEMMSWPLAIWGLIAFCIPVIGYDSYLTTGLGCLSIVYFLHAFQPLRSNAVQIINFPEAYSGVTPAQFPATSQEHSFLLDTLLPREIGIAGAVTLIGVVFKLMYWKGSATMLMAGVGVLAIAVIILALNQRMDQRALFALGLGLLVLFISPKALIRQLHSDEPVLAQKLLYQSDHPDDPNAAADIKSYLQQKRAQR